MTVTLAQARGMVRDLIDEANAWERLESRSVRDEATGCWLWMGALQSEGYGYMSVEGRRWYTHILAYTLVNGSPGARMDVGHQCHDADPSCLDPDVCFHRRCWNPAHLEEQSRRDNLLAGHTLVAAKAAQTHCIHGHEFTPENTRIRTRKEGGRTCRACDAALGREKRASR